jgi:hypothetical protein
MKFVLTMSLLIFLFSACKKDDTCNLKLGNTFDSISVDSSKFIENDHFQINFFTQVLDTLPDEYFEDFILIKRDSDLFGNSIENSEKTIKEIAVNKSQIEIIILRDALPQIGEQEVLNFYLKFSDRKEYIDCFHLGSTDIYFLDLEINIRRVFMDSIYLSEFKWKETLNKGGF